MYWTKIYMLLPEEWNTRLLAAPHQQLTRLRLLRAPQVMHMRPPRPDRNRSMMMMTTMTTTMITTTATMMTTTIVIETTPTMNSKIRLQHQGASLDSETSIVEAL
jgi:hypothetical protein